MDKLPLPYDKFAGCNWLPRILAKARGLLNGTLLPEYIARFGATDGVDGQFLRFFGLEPEQIVQAAGLSEQGISAWFLSLPGVSTVRIAEWNHVSENFGREGYPMAERLPIALSTKYLHLKDLGITTIFEMLAADERSIT